MRNLLIIGALAAFATPGYAAPCNHAKGKFVKCSTKKGPCRNEKGKFVKYAA